MLSLTANGTPHSGRSVGALVGQTARPSARRTSAGTWSIQAAVCPRRRAARARPRRRRPASTPRRPGRRATRRATRRAASTPAGHAGSTPTSGCPAVTSWPGRQPTHVTRPARSARHRHLRLHRLEHGHAVAGLDVVAFDHRHVAHLGRERGDHEGGAGRGLDRGAAGGEGPTVVGRLGQLGGPAQLAARLPAGPLLGERRPLAGAERGDVVVVGGQPRLVVGHVEHRVLDPYLAAARHHVGAQVEQLGGADRVEADLVEEPQQPRALGRGLADRPVAVPHRDGPPDELVAAGPLHAVDAQVGAADADGVLGRPGAGRVVLGGDEAVAGVERGRHRGAEVDVAEAEHEVGRVEDDAVHVVDVVEAVDAADELEVARAPRGVGADDPHVDVDRLTRGRVVPAQRQVDDAAGDADPVDVGQVGVELAARARGRARP